MSLRQVVFVHLTRPNLSNLPAVALPDGCQIRPFRAGDEGTWLEIVRHVEKVRPVDDDAFVTEFSDDAAFGESRLLFAEDSSSRSIGTVAARHGYGNPGDLDGTVCWLAVLPGPLAREISRALFAAALEILEGWHDRAFLNSDSSRIVEITTALDVAIRQLRGRGLQAGGPPRRS